jgi:hypothetical protein
MAAFFKKLALFSIPFILIIVLEVLIDPFNYFSAEKNTEMLKLKENISFEENTYLYKLIDYERNPTPTIILGESRAMKLYPAIFEKLTGEKVSNLAAGGGSLEDVIQIFWEVVKHHKLKKVYIGISLNTYNGILLRDRVTQCIEIKNSLPLYLLNIPTLESTFLICKSKLLNTKIEIDKPPFTREEFWKYQLTDITSRYFEHYKYPKNYYLELRKLSDYCIKNNISLVFVITPTNIEFQNKINEFGLVNDYQKFKNDIKTFGDLYDFEIPNELTKNKDNFKDPYHFKDSIGDIVVHEMVSNEQKYSNYYRFTKPHTIN